MKQKRIPVLGQKNLSMPIERFREKWFKKGFELIDISQLCEFKLGISGWCNDWNNPDEQIYHIKVIYRAEEICSFPEPNKNIDDNYIIFETNQTDITGMDFTIFKLCPLIKQK